MVSSLSIFFLSLSAAICFLMPIGLAIYFYRKEKVSIKALLVGALIFFVFQIATRIPLLNFLSTTNWFIQFSTFKLPYALFLGLTAGLFEEIGRYLGFRYLLKGKLEWKNGIAFGIGHGGIEAILIAGLPIINFIIYAVLINSGQFDSAIASKLPQGMGDTIKNTLLNTPAPLLVVGGIERIFAMTVHIGYSLIVLYGVMKNKIRYLLYAILLHTLLDAPLVIFTNKIGLEVYLFIYAVITFILIVKSRKYFETAQS